MCGLRHWWQEWSKRESFRLPRCRVQAVPHSLGIPSGAVAAKTPTPDHKRPLLVKTALCSDFSATRKLAARSSQLAGWTPQLAACSSQLAGSTPQVRSSTFLWLCSLQLAARSSHDQHHRCEARLFAARKLAPRSLQLAGSTPQSRVATFGDFAARSLQLAARRIDPTESGWNLVATLQLAACSSQLAGSNHRVRLEPCRDFAACSSQLAARRIGPIDQQGVKSSFAHFAACRLQNTHMRGWKAQGGQGPSLVISQNSPKTPATSTARDADYLLDDNYLFGQNMTEHNPAPSPSGHPLLSGPPTLTDIHQIFTHSLTRRLPHSFALLCHSRPTNCGAAKRPGYCVHWSLFPWHCCEPPSEPTLKKVFGCALEERFETNKEGGKRGGAVVAGAEAASVVTASSVAAGAVAAGLAAAGSVFLRGAAGSTRRKFGR
eukprot:scaffold350_cov55-Phaeocystis_antarctica.AAC.3